MYLNSYHIQYIFEIKKKNLYFKGYEFFFDKIKMIPLIGFIRQSNYWFLR